MDLRDKYEKLFLKASSPKSANFSQSTVYSFDKHCKHCRQGLKKPKFHDRRIKKKLYKSGYCSEECKAKGVAQEISVGASHNNTFTSKSHEIVEEMAFTALEIQKQEAKLMPIQKLVLHADRSFKLLSEKLRWLEVTTGEKFYSAKFYRILERAEKEIHD